MQRYKGESTPEAGQGRKQRKARGELEHPSVSCMALSLSLSPTKAVPASRCGSQSLLPFPELLAPWGRSLTENKMCSGEDTSVSISLSIYTSVSIDIYIPICI